jgi:hypothetical protein
LASYGKKYLSPNWNMAIGQINLRAGIVGDLIVSHSFSTNNAPVTEVEALLPFFRRVRAHMRDTAYAPSARRAIDSAGDRSLAVCDPL